MHLVVNFSDVLPIGIIGRKLASGNAEFLDIKRRQIIALLRHMGYHMSVPLKRKFFRLKLGAVQCVNFALDGTG